MLVGHVIVCLMSEVLFVLEFFGFFSQAIKILRMDYFSSANLDNEANQMGGWL